MREGVVVAEFRDPWEAGLARDALSDAGIGAWLEGVDARRHGIDDVVIRLVVPEEAAADALGVLVERMPEHDEEHLPARRPLWVVAVAALVAAALVVGAVPRFLWPWIVLFGLIGYLLWRAVSPRRPPAGPPRRPSGG